MGAPGAALPAITAGFDTHRPWLCPARIRAGTQNAATEALAQLMSLGRKKKVPGSPHAVLATSHAAPFRPSENCCCGSALDHGGAEIRLCQIT
ncbi:MAG: hypothetical protein IPL03_01865 [Sterolibacteriaceae bacterium]|nr:hypothetical protein [Candidatus Methylophosphatis haderslevensis]